MTTDQHIEGILFYTASPMKHAELMKLLDISEESLHEAFITLRSRLEAGATRLLLTDTTAELVTAPELDTFIEQVRKDELKRDIGKAGAETLAIIAYRGPVTRTEIDRIRGVNSSFILRNLLVRGLIEKRGNQKNVQYQATSDLLAHLGVTTRTELPEYEQILANLDAYETSLETDHE